MATGFKDPKIERLDTINNELQHMVDHLMDLPEARLSANTSALSNDAGLMNPKVIELIKNAAIKARKDTATTKNIADIKAIIARIAHETELEIRKIANEKPEKKEKKEESSAVHEETSPFKVEDNIIDKGKNPDNVNKGTDIPGVSEEKLKDNPIIASSAPLPKKAEANQLGKEQKPTHGGDIDRRRESKPDRPLIPGQRKPSPPPPPLTGNTTPPIGKTKVSGVFTGSIPSQKKAAIPTQPGAKPKIPTQQMPEQKTPKPEQTSAEIEAAKTRAPQIEPKQMPVYPLGYEDQEGLPYDLNIFMEPDAPMDRGADVTGNPYARQGNPNAEPYQPSQPYQPSSPHSIPGRGYQPDEGDGGGGGTPHPHKRSRPKIPSLPKVPGGGGKIGTAIKLAQQTPVGRAVTVGIIVFILVVGLLLFIIFGGSDTEEQAKKTQEGIQETLTIDKVKILPLLFQPKIGEKVTYQFNVTDTKPAQEITIIDYIPEGVSLIEQDITSSWTKRTCDLANKTCTYKASENLTPEQLNAPSFSFTVTYLITQLLGDYKSGVEANAIASESGAMVEGYVPPSDNDCGGKYAANIQKNRFLKKNFGDPTCNPNLNKALIDARFRQKDPANAEWWFQVAKCESGYGVNVWRDPNTRRHTPDAGGAWGLVQDGSSIIATPEELYTKPDARGSVELGNIKQLPGLPGGTWGHGGVFDRGDVNWELQIDYAVQLLKKRGKAYWACA